ncbi:MAG: GNAT family N-acetyltransferase [Candidatus Hydrogenedentes bacterium]|nr:GNAT family N-acetyltransferase [Candidatus Hydrogenedentota bacterium]
MNPIVRPAPARLVEPAESLREAFLEMDGEYWAAGEVCDRDFERCDGNFPMYLRHLAEQSQREFTYDGLVPQTTFWLMHTGGTLLGTSRLRHYLTAQLEHEGGHIGYSIRPMQRRKGYGALILALTMEQARATGLRRVLVTCNKENVASARVILKNGGVLESEVVSMRSGKPVSRYWIEL